VIVDELIAGGVTDAVLAPGSRNAPLALALHAADAKGRIRLHVRIDERGAGFLALGIARASGRPVPVATTSGTAVANLHPAVLEAHHGGVPLLVLSADRPPRLRGVGANQVIDQLTVFGSGTLRFQHEFAVAATVPGQNAYWRGQVCRALAATRGGTVGGWLGPAQLNIPFDAPLVPDAENAEYDAVLDDSGAVGWPESLAGRGRPWTDITGPGAASFAVPAPQSGEKCLFVADLTHPLAARLAELGYAVIAEAGGLAGTHVLAYGMHLLADADFLCRTRPDRVIVLGRPTLFRAVTSLLARRDITVDVVDNPSRYTDLAGTARTVAPELTQPAGRNPDEDGPWAGAWRDANAAAARAIDGVLENRDVVSSAVLARTVAAALPDGATLLIGSSQPPRDIARFAAPRDGIRVLANRGVAGIDGTVSTAIGVALAGGDSSARQPAYALMGDLTFLHDVTALAIGPHEPRPDLTIVVANNDGGGIFQTLEQGAPPFAGAFERVFGTPTGVQIAQLAEGFGVEHVLALTAGEVVDEVSAPPQGLRIVEVPVGRSDLRAFGDEVARAVHAAIGREMTPRF
jgi:2-succinyl-5-enolpyruvyl-6-hydroxy-3-cyclohexene-1-carboxylate synthase